MSWNRQGVPVPPVRAEHRVGIGQMGAHAAGDGLLEHVTEVGTYFHEQLNALAKKHSAIVDVRGKGVMLAAELDSADLAKEVLAGMLERRILINRTSETVLRFLPP